MTSYVRKFVERIIEDTAMSGAAMTSAGTTQYETGPISHPMRKYSPKKVILKKDKDDYDPDDIKIFNKKFYANMD